MLNLYRKVNTEDNRLELAKARRIFETCARKSWYEYDKTCTAQLLKACVENANEYWKLLRKFLLKIDLSPDELVDYFEQVNNLDNHFYEPGEDIINFVEHYVNNELQVMFDEVNVPITQNDNASCINNVSSGRPCGSNLLPTDLFIYGTDILALYLCVLFSCWRSYLINCWIII